VQLTQVTVAERESGGASDRAEREQTWLTVMNMVWCADPGSSDLYHETATIAAYKGYASGEWTVLCSPVKRGMAAAVSVLCGGGVWDCRSG
jgi:hypothetical protein